MILQRSRRLVALDARILSVKETVSKSKRVSCDMAHSSLVQTGKVGLGNTGRYHIILCHSCRYSCCSHPPVGVA